MNMLLRGSQLRNTEWVLGVVIYAGHDTKARRWGSLPQAAGWGEST